MSIFSRIKDAIFGANAKAAASPGAAPTSSPSTPSTTRTGTSTTTPASTPSTPPQTVDVAAVLEQMAAKQTQKLNWRTSIVDLMKLLDLDSSLENRKELAKELGYTGSQSDSAAMNIWLHKQVMSQLAAHGGKVPAELRD